jgi:hypothetical protein
MKVNLLSVSALEDMGYAEMFKDGHVLIRSKGVTLDAIVRLGIQKGIMYKVLGQPVVVPRVSWIKDQCQWTSLMDE